MLGQVEEVFETAGSAWEALKRFDQLDVDVSMHLPARLSSSCQAKGKMTSCRSLEIDARLKKYGYQISEKTPSVLAGRNCRKYAPFGTTSLSVFSGLHVFRLLVGNFRQPFALLNRRDGI
jgi:hypothetical protein